MKCMPTRVRHALRFALTTLAAVYLVGVTWELFNVYVLGDAADELSAAATLRFNEVIWRRIAAALAAAVFLMRLGDVHAAPPSWPFAWLLALWLGAASVVTTTALGSGRFAVAGVAAALAVGVWLLLHRRLPGWPGHVTAPMGDAGAPASERDLPRLR
jgi:hypothetical protein